MLFRLWRVTAFVLSIGPAALNFVRRWRGGATELRLKARIRAFLDPGPPPRALTELELARARSSRPAEVELTEDEARFVIDVLRQAASAHREYGGSPTRVRTLERIADKVSAYRIVGAGGDDAA